MSTAIQIKPYEPQYQAEEIARLAKVTEGQMSEAGYEHKDIDFRDLYCNDCPAHEVSPRPETVATFAARVFDEGWKVLSCSRNTALCGSCCDPGDSHIHWADQYEDGKN
jgi:hypothetical protein